MVIPVQSSGLDKEPVGEQAYGVYANYDTRAFNVMSNNQGCEKNELDPPKQGYQCNAFAQIV